MLRLITCNDTYTIGTTPLDKGSARRRDLYLYSTQHTYETNIHATGGNRTRNPSKLVAKDLRLREHGNQDRYKVYCHCYIQTSDYIYKTSAFLLQLWGLVVVAVVMETVSNVSYSYRPGGANKVCSSETSETLATITQRHKSKAY